MSAEAELQPPTKVWFTVRKPGEARTRISKTSIDMPASAVCVDDLRRAVHREYAVDLQDCLYRHLKVYASAGDFSVEPLKPSLRFREHLGRECFIIVRPTPSFTAFATIVFSRFSTPDECIAASSTPNAPPALSKAVFSGTLLQCIAQWLDVPTLVAAAATNRAFHNALTSDIVWQASTFAIGWLGKELVKRMSAVEARSLRKLQHLVFRADNPHYEQSIRLIPDLPDVRTLRIHGHGTFCLRPGDLTTLPNLRSLILHEAGIDGHQLAALAKLPHLDELRLEDNSYCSLAVGLEFDVLAECLRQFEHTTIHMEYDYTLWPSNDMLHALHYMHSVQLQLTPTSTPGTNCKITTEQAIERLVRKTTYRRAVVPASSKLRLITFSAWKGGVEVLPGNIGALLDYFPALEAIKLGANMQNRDLDARILIDYCSQRRLKLIVAA